MARPSGRDIRTEVVEAATKAIQTRGASGFSYGTIAEELGVKAPTIHHHFRRKAELLATAVADYRAHFNDQVQSLDGATARARLEGYAALFLAPAQRDLMCLCGAVVADWHAADGATHAEVARFFDDQHAWLAAEAAHAVDTGEFCAVVNPDTFAAAFIAALEGALLLARVSHDPTAVPAAASCLLDLAATRRGDG